MMIASNAAKRLVSASAAPRSSSAACCPCPSWLIANACPESCAGLDQCAPTRATGGSSSSLSDCTVIYTVRHWHSCVRHRVVALPARHCGIPPLGISRLRVPALCRRRTAPAQVRACAPSRGSACPPQRPAWPRVPAAKAGLTAWRRGLGAARTPARARSVPEAHSPGTGARVCAIAWLRVPAAKAGLAPARHAPPQRRTAASAPSRRHPLPSAVDLLVGAFCGVHITNLASATMWFLGMKIHFIICDGILYPALDGILYQHREHRCHMIDMFQFNR